MRLKALKLVLVLMLCRYTGNLDIVAWQSAHEEGIDPYVDREVPEEQPVAPSPTWPVLTPAGVLPSVDIEQEAVRRHV